MSVLPATPRTLCVVTVTIVTTIVMLASHATEACVPGRSGYRRRAPRRLTPLVIKQYVPNTAEQNELAAGAAAGAISRASIKFRKLVPNYNGDIRFLDDEGTGADRIMSQRCRDKLDTLAVSVMNQWPGVKLRVIESWDEYSEHRSGSLHYEGRAVDITTDDRHPAKYGMLARLAVEAGFDWVYYESKKHVHCSVKPDSANGRRTAGCFERSSTVQTRQGPRPMSALRIDDEVLTFNSDEGRLEYSPVITFLDRDPSRKEYFVKIKTESGEQLVLTRYHLVYRQEYADERASVTYAARILPGDKILTLERRGVVAGRSNASTSTILGAPAAAQSGGGPSNLVGEGGTVRATKVLSVHLVRSQGVYAPLTATGNIVVNGVVASCYALVNDHQLAHRAFAPLRALYTPMRWVRMWLSWLQQAVVASASGVNQDGSVASSAPATRASAPTKQGGKLAQALLNVERLNKPPPSDDVVGSGNNSSNNNNDNKNKNNHSNNSSWESSSSSSSSNSNSNDKHNHSDTNNTSTEDGQIDPVDAYTASFRGVHWYASVLYQLFQSALASYMP